MQVFAAAYHKLVHSPALETILQVENSYAKTFSEVRNSRDEDIKQLTQKYVVLDHNYLIH